MPSATPAGPGMSGRAPGGRRYPHPQSPNPRSPNLRSPDLGSPNLRSPSRRLPSLVRPTLRPPSRLLGRALPRSVRLRSPRRCRGRGKCPSRDECPRPQAHPRPSVWLNQDAWLSLSVWPSPNAWLSRGVVPRRRSHLSPDDTLERQRKSEPPRLVSPRQRWRPRVLPTPPPRRLGPLPPVLLSRSLRLRLPPRRSLPPLRRHQNPRASKRRVRAGRQRAVSGPRYRPGTRSCSVVRASETNLHHAPHRHICVPGAGRDGYRGTGLACPRQRRSVTQPPWGWQDAHRVAFALAMYGRGFPWAHLYGVAFAEQGFPPPELKAAVVQVGLHDPAAVVYPGRVFALVNVLSATAATFSRPGPPSCHASRGAPPVALQARYPDPAGQGGMPPGAGRACARNWRPPTWTRRPVSSRT